MGIKASDDLFQLIKSLSPSEKRAFRLISERHSRENGNNYLRLFDAISQQEEYDEAEIRRQFEGKAFIRNLAEAKSYLYKTLLRVLRFSKGPSSPETELREMLDHLEILNSKGLFEQAKKQVASGLQKATELNLHSFIAEYLRWERRLLKPGGGKHLATDLDRISAEEQQALAHIRIETQLRDLKGRIQAIISRQVDLKDQEAAAELERIWADPLLRKAPVSAGFHSLSAYYFSQAYYFRLRGQLEKALHAWEEVVANFEAHPKLLRREQDQYINALVSLIDMRINIRDLGPFESEMERLRSLKPRDQASEARIFFMVNHLQLRHALVAGNFRLAMERIPAFEEGMQRFANYLGSGLEMTFWFNICALYFLAERYPEAQRYINLVLNRPNLPIRQDISDALKIIEMISRYARGHHDLLEHLHKSQERKLKGQAGELVFARMSVQFVGQLIHAPDAKETQRVIQEMDAKLDALPVESRRAGYEELQLWVKSRHTGQSVEEILQSA